MVLESFISGDIEVKSTFGVGTTVTTNLNDASPNINAGRSWKVRSF